MTTGILFHHTNEEDFVAIQGFLRELSGNNKQVTGLGFIEAHDIPVFYLLKKGITFFCLKDLNWYYKPQADFVIDFINREFDLLINLSLDNYFPVEYVYALSRARFKAGKLTKGYNYDDLTIDVKESRDIKYLIQQFSHYLSIINKKGQKL